MPRQRKTENKGLPARWVFSHGTYYYMPPPDLRARWGGKSWFPLGKSLPDAYQVWAEKINAPERITTIADLLDRFQLEHIPKLAAKTQTEYKHYLLQLRKVFGHMALADIEPQHIYQYVDKRTAKVSAKREIEALSSAFNRAIQWGLLARHPFRGQVRIDKPEARDRYVEDWELVEALSLPPRRKKGSVGMVQAYIRIKLLTGLRQRDLLLMQMGQIKDDGLHVTPSKTRRKSAKKLIYEWSPELRAAIDAAKAIRPAISPYLFCNRFGACYVDEATGTAGDWNNIWQKFMARVLKDTKVSERFTEHDLRAKVASDAESLERAKQLMGHADSKITELVYRRKPERIRPAA